MSTKFGTANGIVSVVLRNKFCADWCNESPRRADKPKKNRTLSKRKVPVQHNLYRYFAFTEVKKN